MKKQGEPANAKEINSSTLKPPGPPLPQPVKSQEATTDGPTSFGQLLNVADSSKARGAPRSNTNLSPKTANTLTLIPSKLSSTALRDEKGVNVAFYPSQSPPSNSVPCSVIQYRYGYLLTRWEVYPRCHLMAIIPCLVLSGWKFPPMWVFYNAPPTMLNVRLRTELDKKREEADLSTTKWWACTRRDRSCGIFSTRNAVRRLASYITAHIVFNLLMVLVIVGDVAHPAPGDNYHFYQLEYFFLTMYIIEMVMKMVAYGIMCQESAYFRIGWNIFDFILLLVMMTSLILGLVLSDHHDGVEYKTAMNILAAMRAFKAIKIFKTVYAIRGLRTLLSAMVNSVAMLSHVLLLSIFWLIVFALFGLQLFMGAFRRRCVLNYPPANFEEFLNSSFTSNQTSLTSDGLTTTTNHTDYTMNLTTLSPGGNFTGNENYSYTEWVYDISNWEPGLDGEGNYYMCGNSSGARPCGSGYTCLELSQVTNPHEGKLSFDDFWSALLASFQLTLLDDWGSVYQKVVEAKGPLVTLYFIAMVFFGSFQLVNTILALINIAYSAQLVQVAKSNKKENEKSTTIRRLFSFFDTDVPEKYRKYSGGSSDTASGVEKRPSPKAVKKQSKKSITEEQAKANPRPASHTAEESEKGETVPVPTLAPPPEEPGLDEVSEVSPRGCNSAQSFSNVNRSNCYQASSSTISTSGLTNRKVRRDQRHCYRSDYMSSMRQSKDDAYIPHYRNRNYNARSDKGEPTGCCGKAWRGLCELRADVAEASEHEMFELTIGLFILVNVIIMALDYHCSPNHINELVSRANAAFTGVFVTEAAIKLTAQGVNFFKSRWNIFDLLIVILGILDYILSGDSAVTVLRAIKILRVLRLARVWKTMRSLINAMSNALPVIANMSVISLIFLLIMALIGMRGLKNYFTNTHDPPRWSFDNFMHSLMMTYIIFCGEFMEPLYSCFDGAEDDPIGRPMCLLAILLIFMLGNLMIMNLYVSIILSNFGSEIFDQDDNHGDIREHIKSAMIQKWARLKTRLRMKKANGNTADNKRDDKENILLNGELVDIDHVDINLQPSIAYTLGSVNQGTRANPLGKRYIEGADDRSRYSLRASPIHSERLRHKDPRLSLSELPGRSSNQLSQFYTKRYEVRDGAAHSLGNFNQSACSIECQSTHSNGTCQDSGGENVNQSARSEPASDKSKAGNEEDKKWSEDFDKRQREAVLKADVAIAKRLLEVAKSKERIAQLQKISNSQAVPPQGSSAAEYEPGVMSRTRVESGQAELIGGDNSRQGSGAGNITIENTLLHALFSRDKGVHLTESEQNQKLLEMLVPKTRRKTVIAVPKKEQNSSSVHQSIEDEIIDKSYDNQMETVVCEKDILNGQVIRFLKCGAKNKDTRNVDANLLLPGNRVIPSMEYLETERRRKQKDDIMTSAQGQTKAEIKLDSVMDLPPPGINLSLSNMPGLNQQTHKQLSDMDRQLKILTMPTGLKVFGDNISRVVNTWVFEMIILLVILVSIVCLALDDIMLIHRPKLAEALYIMNYIILVLFVLELMIRLTAMGFWSYLTNMWCLLDLLIICTSIADIASDSSERHLSTLGSLKAIRCLRALRPLRVVSRLQGIKLIVNALFYSLPSVFNVLCLICVVLLFFAIVATNLFGGKLFYCRDNIEGEMVSASVIPDRNACLTANMSWVEPFWHFDHLGTSYLSMFGIITFDNWLELMISTADGWEVDKQPIPEKSVYTSLIFFTIFSLIGSMFMLNLFIGVMIDSFNNMKKRLEGYNYAETLMTDTQRHFYHMLKNLGRVRPDRESDLPSNKIRRAIFRFAASHKFDNFMLLLIMLNMVVLAFSRYNQDPVEIEILNNIDLSVVVIFTVECVLKLIAFSYKYFKSPWNLLDFVIVVASVFGACTDRLGTGNLLLISPTLLRALRIFRTARALRLVRRFQGLQKILIAMLMSIPALINIGALLLLVMTVYSIIGMQLFMYVKPVDRINEVFNFQTMGGSMMVMFRMLTGDGWTFILESLAIAPPYCNHTHARLSNGTYFETTNGECGSYISAVFFCVTYIIITFQVIVNCYIALILENYEEQSKETDLLSEDDITSFYKVWQQFDPQSTQFITYNKLSDFLDSLKAPLRISKPNKIAISILNINVSTGMKIHCLDLLQRLVSHNLSSAESEEITNIPDNILSAISTQYQVYFPEYLDVEVMSTTKELALTECAIVKLQLWWRSLQVIRARRGVAVQADDQPAL